jgi:hypothetical protein
MPDHETSRVLLRQLVQRRTEVAQRYGGLTLPKIELLDNAFSRFAPSSFADLGCAYRVDGGYSLYAADHWQPKRALLVDTHPTARMVEEAAMRQGLEVVLGNFGDAETIDKIGNVDAIIFFDVLLHQVGPDWDELLKRYAPHTRLFIIHNPQWLGPKTVRLPDLGEENFLKVIPQTRNEALYRAAIDRPTEINPAHQRPNRDVHHIWQWGITDADLIALMGSLGFSLRYFSDNGFFWHLTEFRNHSFIFERGV